MSEQQIQRLRKERAALYEALGDLLEANTYAAEDGLTSADPAILKARAALALVENEDVGMKQQHQFQSYYANSQQGTH